MPAGVISAPAISGGQPRFGVELRAPATGCKSLRSDQTSCGPHQNRAFQLAHRALALKSASVSTTVQWRHTLGVAQYRAGNRQLAVDAFRKSMKMLPNGGAEVWYFLAMAHERLDAARQWCNQAVIWMQEHILTMQGFVDPATQRSSC